MRPDEEANRAEIERDKQTRSNISKGVGTAVGLASGAASARILPFLSTFIPTDLAMKGLSKVAPKVADFLKRGQSMGLKVDEGIQYIRDSLNPREEKQNERTKDNRNIIEQYSPELHQFITQEVAGGRNPIEAAAIAQNDKRFSEVIKKLSKDHKTPWSSIIDSIYGTGQYGGAANASSQTQTSESGQPPLTKAQAAWQAFNQSRQPEKRPDGPGAQALMDILSKVNQKLGQ